MHYGMGREEKRQPKPPHHGWFSAVFNSKNLTIKSAMKYFRVSEVGPRDNTLTKHWK